MTPIADTYKKTLIVATLILALALPFLLIQPVYALPTLFTFNGPYDDETGAALFDLGNVTVTPITSLGSMGASFNFNNTYNYTNPYSELLYFEYMWNGTGTPQYHQYWVTGTDGSSTRTLSCYFSESGLTTYTIAFRDYTGILKTYPYVVIKNGEDDSGAGTATDIVEKRKVDSQNSIQASLVSGKTYEVWLYSNTATHYYGELTTSATTGIELVIRGVDFPKETLQLYKYVHANAVRDFLNPTGAITVSYEDLSEATTSVTVTITNAATDVDVYTGVFASNNSFSLTYASATNATSYQVTTTVTHATYGELVFKQYMLGEYEKASDPFDLSFLGGDSVTISTAVLVPALLIIFVAGCFSELTSEAAAILTVIVAILLTALGFIEISQSVLIIALSLAVLGGVVAVRRRSY